MVQKPGQSFQQANQQHFYHKVIWWGRGGGAGDTAENEWNGSIWWQHARVEWSLSASPLCLPLMEPYIGLSSCGNQTHTSWKPRQGNLPTKLKLLDICLLFFPRIGIKNRSLKSKQHRKYTISENTTYNQCIRWNLSTGQDGFAASGIVCHLLFVVEL